MSYLGGAHSLTPSRADLLHRDGQFADWVPTSTTRGVVRPDRIPEALEAMYWVHRHLIGSDRTDTQVQECDTVGHSTRINNERSRVLARCDMGSLVQTSHHWAPLTFEAEQITTERVLGTWRLHGAQGSSHNALVGCKCQIWQDCHNQQMNLGLRTAILDCHNN